MNFGVTKTCIGNFTRFLFVIDLSVAYCFHSKVASRGSVLSVGHHGHWTTDRKREEVPWEFLRFWHKSIAKSRSCNGRAQFFSAVRRRQKNLHPWPPRTSLRKRNEISHLKVVSALPRRCGGVGQSKESRHLQSNRNDQETRARAACPSFRLIPASRLRRN